MYEQVEKTPEQKSQSVANTISQRQSSNALTSRFVDNRPEAIQMRKLRTLAKQGPQNAKLRELHHLAAAHSVAQKKGNVKQGFGFVDNRPEAIAQRKLQKMANNNLQAPHTKRNNKPQKKSGHNVFQLFGLTVGGGQEAFELDAAHVGLISSVEEENIYHHKLQNLAGEKLTILGHGIPALGKEPSKVDKYNPNQFVTKLISLGYNPANHTGDIDFKSCTAGWARTRDGSFISQVKVLLANNGYNGNIIGVEGFALAIPGARVPLLNSPAEADEHGIARYQDFGIFRQWRTWNTFLEQVVQKKLEEANPNITTDEQIELARDIDDNLKVEISRQVNELKTLYQTSNATYRSGIKNTITAMLNSAEFWFKKMSKWTYEGISKVERESAMEYVVRSRRQIKKVITDEIATYGSEPDKYLRPLAKYTNVPASPQVVRRV